MMRNSYIGIVASFGSVENGFPLGQASVVQCIYRGRARMYGRIEGECHFIQ
ncbi:hypothetical protein [Photorhabdus viridis]|uniref:hypothetical protein n=1 Tax=Photorhabdus viridis TaxID=3163327 RepID=UPI0033077446